MAPLNRTRKGNASTAQRLVYTAGTGGSIRMVPNPTRASSSSPTVSPSPASSPTLSTSPTQATSPTPIDEPIVSPNGSAVNNRNERLPEESRRSVTPSAFRIFLKPDQRYGYRPNLEATRRITSIIQLRLQDFVPTWTDIPLATREQWFEDWQVHFTWAPENHLYMWKAFNTRGGSRLSSIYSECRRPEKPKPKRWMLDRFWADLNKHWETEEFKKRSEANKKNRSSENGGALHTCGSLSFGTIRDRMTEELGREPNDFEILTRTKLKADGQWVKPRDQEVAVMFENRLAEVQAEKPGIELSNEEINIIFREVAGPPKKGRVYGLSFHTREIRYFGSNEHIGSSKQMEEFAKKIQDHVSNAFVDMQQQVSSEVGQLRREMTEQRSQLNSLEQNMNQATMLFQDNQALMALFLQQMTSMTPQQPSPTTHHQRRSSTTLQPPLNNQQQPYANHLHPVVSEQRSFRASEQHHHINVQQQPHSNLNGFQQMLRNQTFFPARTTSRSPSPDTPYLPTYEDDH